MQHGHEPRFYYTASDQLSNVEKNFRLSCLQSDQNVYIANVAGWATSIGSKRVVAASVGGLFHFKAGCGRPDIPIWLNNHLENVMANNTKQRIKRAPWTKADVAGMRKYSKDKLPVKKISKLMKRTVGALRRKAGILGIRLGHRR